MGNNNENALLEPILQRVLPDVVFPGDTISGSKVRAVLADCNYDGDKGWSLDAGIAWTRRHLERSIEPVLIIGYDREETVRRRAEGSLLENSGVAYIRLPARLENIRASIKSLQVQETKLGELDEESVLRNKEDVKKNIRLLRHNIRNLLRTISNIRLIDDPDIQFVRTQWPTVRNRIIDSKIDRVDKEIELFNNKIGIGKDDDIYEKLMEANRLYKLLFGYLSSDDISYISLIIENGEALIQLLEGTVNKLEG